MAITKKLQITVDGKEIIFEEKSHAAIFRSFFNHFIEQDTEKTIQTIELAGIRTSENSHFVAVGGQKKKNIFVKDDLYVYTHLTPGAMQKAYEKFVKGWEGKFEIVATEEHTPEPNTPENEETQPEQVVEQIPEATEATEATSVNDEADEASETQITLDEVAIEKFGKQYDELLGWQKGQTKAHFNKLTK